MSADRDELDVPRGYVRRMKHALRVAGSRFTSRRMVQEYATDFYVPALRGTMEGDDPPADGGFDYVPGSGTETESEPVESAPESSGRR